MIVGHFHECVRVIRALTVEQSGRQQATRVKPRRPRDRFHVKRAHDLGLVSHPRNGRGRQHVNRTAWVGAADTERSAGPGSIDATDPATNGRGAPASTWGTTLGRLSRVAGAPCCGGSSVRGAAPAGCARDCGAAGMCPGTCPALPRRARSHQGSNSRCALASSGPTRAVVAPAKSRSCGNAASGPSHPRVCRTAGRHGGRPRLPWRFT